MPTCTGKDINLPIGTCKTCGDYTVPDAARKQCIPPACGPGHKILPNATCDKCPNFQAPDKNKKNCL